MAARFSEQFQMAGRGPAKHPAARVYAAGTDALVTLYARSPTTHGTSPSASPAPAASRPARHLLPDLENWSRRAVARIHSNSGAASVKRRYA